MLPSVGFAVSDLIGGLGYYRGRVPCRMIEEAGRPAVVGGALEFPVGGGAISVIEAEDVPGVSVRETARSSVPAVIVLAGAMPHHVRAGGIHAAQLEGQSVVVDIDDTVWLPSWHPHHSPAIERARLEAIRAADIVTVGTPALAREVGRFSTRPPIVVPNVIDVGEAGGRLPARGIRADRYVIGYRGDLRFRRGDLEQLGDAAARVLEAVPHARFCHVGADDPEAFARILGVPLDRCEARPVQAFDHYLSSLGGIDLAIIPFAGTRYAQAKGAQGALEWSIMGVPWISSRQPEYLEAGKAPTGTLRWAFPSSRREWRSLLEQFGRRPAQRNAQWSLQIRALLPRMFGVESWLRQEMEVPAERVTGAWLTAIDRAQACR